MEIAQCSAHYPLGDCFSRALHPALAISHSPDFRPGRRKSKTPLAPKRRTFPRRAKRVIFLCMEGGPSHVDTFDYKPQAPRRRRQVIQQGPRRCQRQAARLAVEVHAARPKRPVDLRTVPRTSPSRPTNCASSTSMHTRSAEPSAGVRADAYRHLSVPAAIARGVGALRPGHREREPARIRHPQPAGQLMGDRSITARRSCRSICQGTRIGAGGRPGRRRRRSPISRTVQATRPRLSGSSSTTCKNSTVCP